FCEPDAYNDRYFDGWFVHPPMKDFVPRVPWQAFSGGTGEGVIVGGYTLNFACFHYPAFNGIRIHSK
ncbi:hypothetical protein OSL60_28985, partial [Escherichia coli]|nr:hypothetical protein [Escherichia coli]